MGDPFKKVQSGQKLYIPAEVFNAFIDVARDYKMRQRDSLTGQAGIPWKQTGIVLVQNETGADRDRFDVVGLGSPIISSTDNLQEFQNRPTFIAEAPNETVPGGHMGRFGILQEPCRSGEMAPAVVSGITVARVSKDEQRPWEEKARIRTDQYSHLSSSETGPVTVLWKEPGPGIRWAIVRLDDYVIVDEFWAMIMSPEEIAPNRYRYSFYEAIKVGPGYQGWDIPYYGYRSGYAYNTVEIPNSGSYLGNGIDPNEEPSGSRLKPLGEGAIVRMKEMRFFYNGQQQVEYWFQGVNAFHQASYWVASGDVDVIVDLQWIGNCLGKITQKILLPQQYVYPPEYSGAVCPP